MRNLSKYTSILIIIILTLTVLNIGLWKSHSVIKNDVNIYYSYLPAAFIYHDLSFKFTDNLPKNFPGTIWYVKTDDGKRVQKCTMGLAILYLPFFLAAHALALLFGLTANGYGQIYHFFIALSALFYTAIGLLFLRKILLKYFNEAITTITLISVYLGTNLFYYVTSEGAMSHSYDFFLFTIIIYYSIKWHDSQKLKYAIIIGLTGGLITLIRPTNLLIMLFPLLLRVSNIKDLKEKILLFYEKRKQIIVLFIVFVLMFIPQFIYWKYATGHWLYFSYRNENEGNAVERFYFLKPHIIEGLFGYRKGWFLYTPIMLFAIGGIIVSIFKKYEFRAIVTIFTVINIYVILSWWSWWYGGGYGLRAFIDSYALLALPMGVVYQWLFSGRLFVRITVSVIIFCLIGLSLFQTLQFKRGIIHWDSMTKENYWRVLGRTTFPPDPDKYLKAPDYSAAIKGEDEK